MTTSSLICVISIASFCENADGKPPALFRLPPRARAKRLAQVVSAGHKPRPAATANRVTGPSGHAASSRCRTDQEAGRQGHTLAALQIPAER